MLTIRREQMEALKQHAIDTFVLRVTTQIGTAFPATSLPELTARVQAAISIAQEYHLLRERDIARFVELSLVRLKPDAVLPREILCVLTRYGMDPEEKLNHLERWLAELPQEPPAGSQG